MVMTNNGINLIRDLITGASTAKITNGGMGTDNTTPTSADTGLNVNTNLGTSGTIIAITSATTDRQIVFTYTLPTGSGNGNTYKEFGLSNGSILFNRQTFYDIAKDASKEIDISLAIRISPE